MTGRRRGISRRLRCVDDGSEGSGMSNGEMERSTKTERRGEGKETLNAVGDPEVG